MSEKNSNNRGWSYSTTRRSAKVFYVHGSGGIDVNDAIRHIKQLRDVIDVEAVHTAGVKPWYVIVINNGVYLSWNTFSKGKHGKKADMIRTSLDGLNWCVTTDPKKAAAAALQYSNQGTIETNGIRIIGVSTIINNLRDLLVQANITFPPERNQKAGDIIQEWKVALRRGATVTIGTWCTNYSPA